MNSKDFGTCYGILKICQHLVDYKNLIAFVTINGFSNSYYGWGLEDDDARERVLSKFKSIKRLTPQVGRYYANCHKQSTKNPNRFILYIKACLQRQVTDGLNSLAYSIEKIEKSYLYTKIYIHYKNDY